jgi:catechol 2,3-dioxygenase-like lactoylglutathione lyase family enzyme
MLTIFVANMDESLKFYAEVAGFQLLRRFGNEFAMLIGKDGMKVGLHPASAKSPAGKLSIGIEIPDSIQTRVAEMKATGVRFSSDVVDDGQVLAAHFNDPNGVELYLVEVKPQYKQYA